MNDEPVCIKCGKPQKLCVWQLWRDGKLIKVLDGFLSCENSCSGDVIFVGVQLTGNREIDLRNIYETHARALKMALHNENSAHQANAINPYYPNRAGDGLGNSASRNRPISSASCQTVCDRKYQGSS